MSSAELTEVEEIAPRPEPELEGLYEIVDGKVVEKAMGVQEIDIANDLLALLRGHVKRHALGRAWTEMLFLTIPATSRRRRPDVAFLSAGRWPLDRDLPEAASFDLAPDLAVEVVSPSDSADDLNRKVHEYFGAGVRQVWVIYRTTATVVVHESPTLARTLTRADVLDGGAVVPGFRLPVSDLLREPRSAPAAPTEPEPGS